MLKNYESKFVNLDSIIQETKEKNLSLIKEITELRRIQSEESSKLERKIDKLTSEKCDFIKNVNLLNYTINKLNSDISLKEEVSEVNKII